MMLLKAVGVNDNGWLSDKEMAERLKDMPDEIWTALKLATTVHGGYSCSPFISKDWAEKAIKKIGVKKEDVVSFKEYQLEVVFGKQEE